MQEKAGRNDWQNFTTRLYLPDRLGRVAAGVAAFLESSYDVSDAGPN
ncbi:MAG: hypothetical protein HON53_00550 [Planctomycetaceae bacterium]|nr:hypothetical protein [Planctomycetaceae bacterium]MBT6157199.1 hypothetical protein [Planctomycetaceae bacterium]MBT6486980.1 hypothetical protein [Planctomycetaceae bacterium]MBT6497176.1 hypothetical protein [Planctomycetaceae bacterium]